MTSSDRAWRVAFLLVLVLAGSRAAGAVETRVGGTLGFGIGASREPGAFRWDLHAAQPESALAALKLGVSEQPLCGFVAIAARLEDTGSQLRTRFELREASIRTAWQRTARDSLALRLFARQPQSLWVEFALVPPIAPGALGPDPLGARADAAWGPATAAVLVARRGTLFDPDPVVTQPAWDPPAEDLLLARLRGDALRWGGLRVGATWKRWHPAAESAGATPPLDARVHDVLGLDVRGGWRGIVASAAVSGSHASGAPPDASEPAGRRSAGPVTAALSTRAAFRAELRARALALGRLGAIGFAPQYRALGRDHIDRVVATEREPGSPRRGLEGYRLEAWYEFPVWPAWCRYAYDRHQQFRDADRRVIAQISELHVQLTEAVRAEARYAQRDERLDEWNQRDRHDDLLAALGAADGRSHCRLQAGVLDLDGERERTVLVLEAGARIGRRMQASSRITTSSEDGFDRRSFFGALQYWHLPEFELALEYGPTWMGDAALPVLDGDLTADGHDLDRVRLHFRGWF